jgi:putative NADH-flavin reductase
MKIFVAGATGVVGRALVPQLVARGHEVVGMTRAASKQDLVRSLGARPVVADALDPDAVAQAVASAEPEVIVHEPRAEAWALPWVRSRCPGERRCWVALSVRTAGYLAGVSQECS